MKKVIILSALRTGSSYLTDNLSLSMLKQHKINPAVKHYSFRDNSLNENDGVVIDTFSVTKISWIDHLEQLRKFRDLSDYDAIFLKRKDKFAQCISMVTSAPNPYWTFNFYKREQHLWEEWLRGDPKFEISKETFSLYFWMREHLEKGVDRHKTDFKKFIELDYEDIDENLDNLKGVLKNIDVEYHNEDDDAIPMKRNWDKWGSVINKQEVLSWAEPLFKERGYVINPEYYK